VLIVAVCMDNKLYTICIDNNLALHHHSDGFSINQTGCSGKTLTVRCTGLFAIFWKLNPKRNHF